VTEGGLVPLAKFLHELAFPEGRWVPTVIDSAATTPSGLCAGRLAASSPAEVVLSPGNRM